MITLKGTGIHPGIVIATAAVMDFTEGTSSLPSSILQRAASALRRQLADADQPEVILVTEQLIFGATVKIPGLQKTALIIESSDEVPQLPINVPCVVGVAEATKQIPNEAIVIVDGYSGDIIVDPEAQMMIHYQNEIEEHKSSLKQSLLSMQETAVTPQGRVIQVAARVRSVGDLQTALTYGADALVAEVSLFDRECDALIESMMGAVGDRKITLIPDQIFAPWLDFVLSLSLPGQIAFAFPGEDFQQWKRQMEQCLNSMSGIRLMVLAQNASDIETAKAHGAEVLIEQTHKEMASSVAKWTAEEKPAGLIVSLGETLDLLAEAVKAGALVVETTPDLVAKVKESIRKLPV